MIMLLYLCGPLLICFFERWEGGETEEHRRATVAEVVGSGDVDF